MSTLDIVKLRAPEDAHLVEHRFLLEETAAVARQVYSEVELRVVDSGERLPSSRADHVLLVGMPNVLLAAPSLALMAAALAEGFVWSRPSRLSDFDVLREDPVFTLPGYERLEARILSERLEPRSSRVDPMPVALLTPTLYRTSAAGRAAKDRAGSTELFATLRSSRGARRGVCHEFSDYYGQVRDDILDFVPHDTRSVLEVGCGRGGTAELLERRLGCRVTGVELNPIVAAEARRRIHRVFEGDVEKLPIDGTFDLVLALEVIEHLVDPEAFLRTARRVTRPGGRIILSTPNVGHYSLVEDLETGRWEYLPSGAMCYTHLRFFTRSTLERLLRRAGFPGFRIVGQPTELPARWSHQRADRERRSDARFEPDWDSLATLAFYVIIDP